MPNTHRKKSHQIIKSFEAEALKKRPLSLKIADFFTSSFGTVSFLLGNILIYGSWIYLNSGKVSWFTPVDPYPYSFLNSFVSLEAIFLTVIVLISQNRQNERTMLRNELGLQVELISEKENTKILKLLKKILENKEKYSEDPELEEMIKEIDASYIERKLEEQLESSEKTLKL